MIGSSPALRKILEQVAIVAPTPATVLIQGESGTGKELVARAIHDRSSRRIEAPDRGELCVDSTRAVRERVFRPCERGVHRCPARPSGRFQAATGGTLFLDEVGEIPLELQAKLLRVLQEGQFERVGEEVTRTVDVRVLAATNRDLQQEVVAGRFRPDLFYRLSVFPIVLPPLRDRPEDIPQLAAHFVEQAARRYPGEHRDSRYGQSRYSKRTTGLETSGNCSTSLNAPSCCRLAMCCDLDGVLTESNTHHRLRFQIRPRDSARGHPRVEWRRRERQNIRTALELANGRIYGPDGAAELLGIKPTTLISRLKALGLRDAEKRSRRLANRRST